MNWLKKNWKSVAAGILTMGFTAYRAYTNPATLLDPQTLATTMSGLGLIALNESGSTKPPAAPAK